MQSNVMQRCLQCHASHNWWKPKPSKNEQQHDAGSRFRIPAFLHSVLRGIYILILLPQKQFSFSCTYIYSVLSCIINSSFVISNTYISPNVKWKWNRTLKETLKINYHHRAHMVIKETTYRGLMKMPADYEPYTCLRIILNFYIKV